VADKMFITLEVDDKGSAVVKKFDHNTQAAFDKVKKNSTAGATQAGKMARKWNSAIDSIKNKWKTYSAVAGVAMAATIAAVTAGAKKFLASASDLQEVQSKFDVVFAGQEARAESWALTLVNAYAMSTREAKQYLASVQDLLVPMGMDAKAAGVLSNEIVKLSADLGSFNNLPTAQVMENIQSALTGEYESMKKYGIVINATTVQQKALNMGLAATKDELTAGMKAQAAYALMVEGSTAAIGDMSRTMGGAANQEKQTKALLEDISVLLGKTLIPYYQEILKLTNKWLKANKAIIEQNLPEYIQKVGSVVVNLGDAVRFLHNAWAGIGLLAAAQINAISVSVDGLVASLRFVLLPLDLIFKGLEKIGLIDANPFDQLQEGTRDLIVSSLEATASILAEIEKTNQAYDSVIAKVEGWKKKIAEAPVEQVKASEETIKQIKKQESAVEELGLSNDEVNIEYLKSLIAQRKEENRAAKEAEKLYGDRAKAARDMYGDLDDSSLDYFKEQKKLLKIQRDDYIELTGDKALAEAWFTDQKEKLDDQKLLSNGNFVDGIKLGYKEMTRETKTWAERGKGFARDVADNFNRATDDIIDKWIAGENKKVSVSEAAGDMLRDTAGSAAKMMKDAAIGEVMGMIGAWLGNATAQAGSEGPTWQKRLINAGLYLAGATTIILGSRAVGKKFKAQGGWIENHPMGGPINEGSRIKDDVYLTSTPGINHWGMGGEFVVNRQQTAKHYNLIDDINSGRIDSLGSRKPFAFRTLCDGPCGQGHAKGGPVGDWKDTADKLHQAGAATFYTKWKMTGNIWSAIADAVIYYSGLVATSYGAKKKGDSMLGDLFFNQGGVVGAENVGYGWGSKLWKKFKREVSRPFKAPQKLISDPLAFFSGEKENISEWLKSQKDNNLSQCIREIHDPTKIWDDIKGSLRTLIKPFVISLLTPNDYSAWKSGVWDDWGKGWKDYYKDKFKRCAGVKTDDIKSSMPPIPGFGQGTGLQGLPRTGFFRGHKGEIVKSPSESEMERRGGSGRPLIVKVYVGNEEFDGHIRKVSDDVCVVRASRSMGTRKAYS